MMGYNNREEFLAEKEENFQYLTYNPWCKGTVPTDIFKSTQRSGVNSSQVHPVQALWEIFDELAVSATKCKCNRMAYNHKGTGDEDDSLGLLEEAIAIMAYSTSC
jgi:hypothetical protein